MPHFNNGFSGTPPDADPTSPGAGQGPPQVSIDTPSLTPPSSTPTTPGGGVDWNRIIQGGAELIPGITNYLTNRQGTSDSANQVKLIQGMTDKYGTLANPYGAYRDASAQRLQDLQNDPSSIVNTPGYKFALSQVLGAVGNRDTKRFGVGAGSTDPDLMTFAHGLASKTYNDTIKQLQDQAGVGIGTGPAAGIYGQGISGIAQNTAAGNAAKGANTNLLGQGAAALIKALIGAGLSPSMAAQIAKMFGGGVPAAGGREAGGTGGVVPEAGGSDAGGAGGGTGGDPGGDPGGTPSISDTPYDWSGGYQVPDFGSGFGGMDMGI